MIEKNPGLYERRRDPIAEHRMAYLNSRGAEGHIVSKAAVGGHGFGVHLLLRYRGRKSGRTFITPLCYGHVGGEVVVVASKGGSDEHPAWYLNLRESDSAEFQIGGQAFRASWREPTGEERRKVWDHMVGCYPFYATYQAATDRQIPLVMLQVEEDIPIFQASDLADAG